MTWSVVEDTAMTRFVPGFIVLCVILLLAGCAQSVHQTERLAQSDFLVDPGYAGTSVLFLLARSRIRARVWDWIWSRLLGTSARVLWRSLRAARVRLVWWVWRLRRSASSIRHAWPSSVTPASRTPAVQEKIVSLGVIAKPPHGSCAVASCDGRPQDVGPRIGACRSRHRGKSRPPV
jgi:hypothetical protein